eukprot:jgi/Chrpa1/22481/Chrysochromulina_OHIO_Genome00007347-RA
MALRASSGSVRQREGRPSASADCSGATKPLWIDATRWRRFFSSPKRLTPCPYTKRATTKDERVTARRTQAETIAKASCEAAIISSISTVELVFELIISSISTVELAFELVTTGEGEGARDGAPAMGSVELPAKTNTER